MNILGVSVITYLPLSTGHSNKGNPLIGVEHSFFIFIIPKGAKQVRYYWDTQYNIHIKVKVLFLMFCTVQFLALKFVPGSTTGEKHEE